jgi:AmmeMemoRadiSam system protein B/AmmeMemoRadiSam system protein A
MKKSMPVILLFAAACGQSDGQTPPEPERVRPPALAGRGWYPGSAGEAGAKTGAFLDAAPKWEGARPIALIAPHAGWTYAGREQGRVMKVLTGHKYDRVFLLGPPHRMAARGVVLPEYTHFETPLGKVPVDRKAVDSLVALGSPFSSRTPPHAEEHSLEILLPFLQRTIGPFSLVPMLVHVEPGQLPAVAKGLGTVLGPGDLVVASSDNCHYGERFDYQPFPVNDGVLDNLRNLDMGAVEKILAKDLAGYIEYREKTGISTCGFSPICVLLSLLPPEAKGALTGYDTSASAGGDRTSVVSYVGVVFAGGDWPPPAKAGELGPEDRKAALGLARSALEHAVKTGKVLDPEAAGLPIPDALRPDRGVFVTLKIGEDLRGCIGDIFAERPLFKAIAGRAYSSALSDSRFRPVREEELPRIRIELSVLSPLAKVARAEEIVIGTHGILLLIDGERRSVYLPQVATEQGWDLAQTLGSLCRKGGLPSDAWRTPRASFEVFTAEVFGE